MFASMFQDWKLPKDNVELTGDAHNQPRKMRSEGHVAHIVEALQTFIFGSETLECKGFSRDLNVKIILIMILEK
jgi:hypothetical protein